MKHLLLDTVYINTFPLIMERNVSKRLIERVLEKLTYVGGGVGVGEGSLFITSLYEEWVFLFSFSFFLLSKQIPADRATEVMEHSKWWLVGVASKFQSSHGCASFLWKGNVTDTWKLWITSKSVNSHLKNKN